ncbi:hypothetical protein P5V15_012063 [Pogonomyrmex californicus]
MSTLHFNTSCARDGRRFHGKGYAIKELQPEKFFDIVSRLQEVRYLKTSTTMHGIACNIFSLRAVDYLRRHGYDAVFCDKIEDVLSNAYDVVMKKNCGTAGATLCHGDFTMDNILFKTEDNGQIRTNVD